MGVDRRDFLKIAGLSAAMGLGGKIFFELLAPGEVDASLKDIPSIVKIRLNSLDTKNLIGFSVPNSNDLWSIEKLQKEWLTENRMKDGCEVFLAEKDNQVIGFIFYNMENQ